MIFTKECHYAVKAVLRLAEVGKISVKDLCEIENIPLAFGYKIMKKLADGGILVSHRGSRGGHQLATKPCGITILNIVQVMEDAKSEFLGKKCLVEEQDCERHCPVNPCSLHTEITRIHDKVVEELGRYSVKDLVGSLE